VHIKVNYGPQKRHRKRWGKKRLGEKDKQKEEKNQSIKVYPLVRSCWNHSIGGMGKVMNWAGNKGIGTEEHSAKGK